MRHPFLIITTHTSLSRWEDEFSCCAPSINVVVYKGSEDVRSFIRTVEFHNEQGAIMFHVLISHCDTADQDIEIFKSISWEAIIIDTSQRSFAPRSLRHITVLSSNKKLLLLRQVEDRRSDYRKFLSLLDPDYEETNGDFPASSGSETEYMKLKERFTKFVAYECKTSAISKFIEYWVPVRLSDLQVEQYCACLLSNSHLLCSTLKSTDSFSTLHDILMATRKCCDHPYLVDWTLGRSIVKGLPVDAHLDVEIELSGKLQLLSRILIEVRKRGLRVLILFQALPASGQISVGDILDDFIHQKFGKDCLHAFVVNVSPPMRRSILNKFNSKESGKFVLLMETRACSPSTKLSDIDSVILFNSDWDPANDFRALQKVSIDSKFEHLSIFRLYSSCTIEEKILILAKRG
ncbi:unnamed protein product [Cuscuta epithymum]|uniref:SNF2 N-terminal domain-containing protein n=1 Tax=Cuscuta epithymum TaxID=186058 RepID=A0AAV0E6F0_9ASTE|nr:unnamed protein product [Cuscuta epithymum]